MHGLVLSSWFIVARETHSRPAVVPASASQPDSVVPEVEGLRGSKESRLSAAPHEWKQHRGMLPHAVEVLVSALGLQPLSGSLRVEGLLQLATNSPS